MQKNLLQINATFSDDEMTLAEKNCIELFLITILFRIGFKKKSICDNHLIKLPY